MANFIKLYDFLYSEFILNAICKTQKRDSNLVNFTSEKPQKF